MHDLVISGHLGCKKTKAKILQKFYWYGLREDVAMHIRKCGVKPRAPMGSLRTGAPADCLATDYLGLFPVTERG